MASQIIEVTKGQSGLPSRAAIALLLTDIFLILAYLVARVLEIGGVIPDTPLFLKIGEASSVASIWIYAKLFLILAFLASLAVRHPRRGFLALALFFLALLIDDSLELHEAFGFFTEESLGRYAAFGLRPKDVGELVFFGGLLVIAIIAFTIAYRRTDGADRNLVRDLILLTVLLAFFGVGMDMVHIILMTSLDGTGGRIAQGLAGAIEDGGEMIVFSLILLRVARHFFKLRETAG